VRLLFIGAMTELPAAKKQIIVRVQTSKKFAAGSLTDFPTAQTASHAKTHPSLHAFGHHRVLQGRIPALSPLFLDRWDHSTVC
jgi:hypothetical protein